jgi:DnaJ family protein C protein 28
MGEFDRIAEEKIRRAMEAGEFDRLPGKGKPLKLDENPYEPEGMGAAFRMLKENNFTLPWIEEGMEIERKRLLAHRSLREACSPQSSSEAIRQAQEQFAQRIESLNQEVIHYNLRVPGSAFQRKMLNLEAERAAALSPRLTTAALESKTQE